MVAGSDPKRIKINFYSTLTVCDKFKTLRGIFNFQSKQIAHNYLILKDRVFVFLTLFNPCNKSEWSVKKRFIKAIKQLYSFQNVGFPHVYQGA
jgi:hypothetical protein